MPNERVIRSVEEWRAALMVVYSTGQTLAMLPLAEMIAQAERGQAIGPLLDPTLWIKNGKAAAEDLKVLRAAAIFAAVLPAPPARDADVT